MELGILGLLVMGAVVGFLADLIDKKHDNSWLVNVALGVVGAFVGGFLRHLLTASDKPMVFDFWSFVWALVGTLVVLAIYHAVRPRIDRSRVR